MKRKHALTEESESIDMVVTSDDHATKEIMIDARFTSFLEKDNSFLTPWSWDPLIDNNSTKEKEYLSFHPESYFIYEIIDQKCWNDNVQVTDNQFWPSTRDTNNFYHWIKSDTHYYHTFSSLYLFLYLFSYNLSPQPFFSSPLAVNSFLNLHLSDKLHLPPALFFNKQVRRRRQQYQRRWQFYIENVAVVLSMKVDSIRSINLHTYTSLTEFYDSCGEPLEMSCL
ncbi:hypothetical protein MTR_4g119170 [Medicago truncatula]|uniref:Uncharacterized protein n=1 Tax=Medicago truncatula TaxID=3880 RepID=G7JK91_MEDTR|nr:hypothetical protein MTR_4g119170 [Medicago truncatula]